MKRRKAKSVKAWALYKDGKLDSFCLHKTRQYIIDCVTGGNRDDAWWNRCKKNGYHIARVIIREI